jgi:hypothetical protein
MGPDTGTPTTPHRVQLSRKRGWRKPDNTVVVARPSKWGNPFRIERVQCSVPSGGLCYEVRLNGVVYADHLDSVERARERAVELFSLHTGPMGVIEWDDDQLKRVRDELGGKNLACWCPPGPCHADVLLEIANR